MNILEKKEKITINECCYPFDIYKLKDIKILKHLKILKISESIIDKDDEFYKNLDINKMCDFITVVNYKNSLYLIDGYQRLKKLIEENKNVNYILRVYISENYEDLYNIFKIILNSSIFDLDKEFERQFKDVVKTIDNKYSIKLNGKKKSIISKAKKTNKGHRFNVYHYKKIFDKYKCLKLLSSNEIFSLIEQYNLNLEDHYQKLYGNKDKDLNDEGFKNYRKAKEHKFYLGLNKDMYDSDLNVIEYNDEIETLFNFHIDDYFDNF